MDSRKGETKAEASAAIAGSEEQMGFSNPKVNEEGKASVCVGEVTRQMSPLTTTLITPLPLNNKFTPLTSNALTNNNYFVSTNFNDCSSLKKESLCKREKYVDNVWELGLVAKRANRFFTMVPQTR